MVSNKNIPKVITNENEDLIYISRAVIPNKKNENLDSSVIYKKQVCIYSYFKNDLKEFLSMGRKSYIENIEDIEILRFLEIGYTIKMVDLKGTEVAVDNYEDLKKVKEILNNNKTK